MLCGHVFDGGRRSRVATLRPCQNFTPSRARRACTSTGRMVVRLSTNSRIKLHQYSFSIAPVIVLSSWTAAMLTPPTAAKSQTIVTTQRVVSQPNVAAGSYVCPQCGRVHASRPSVSAPTSAQPGVPAVPKASPAVPKASPAVPKASPAVPKASPVVTAAKPAIDVSTSSSTIATGTSSGIARTSHVGPIRSGVQNVLSMLNGQRSRQGLRTLRYDPALQAVAERRAQQMASSGLKGHPPGSFAPGRYEGVGWSSSYSPRGVYACYTSDPNMTAAGAAMVSGRDGVYFAVVYR